MFVFLIVIIVFLFLDTTYAGDLRENTRIRNFPAWYEPFIHNYIVVFFTTVNRALLWFAGLVIVNAWYGHLVSMGER